MIHIVFNFYNFINSKIEMKYFFSIYYNFFSIITNYRVNGEKRTKICEKRTKKGGKSNKNGT
jgi:hypothetical protein